MNISIVKSGNLPRSKTSLWAKIDEKGNLIMEGYDYGKFVEEFWGDEDYEYSVTVEANNKDWLLLNLVKDRFKCSSGFKEYLNSRKIKHEFMNWI